MTIDPANDAIDWTPDEFQGPSSNVVKVVVTDTNAAAVTYCPQAASRNSAIAKPVGLTEQLVSAW
jgi:hypothetical protein